MADTQVQGVPQGLTEEELPKQTTQVQGVPAGLTEEPLAAPSASSSSTTPTVTAAGSRPPIDKGDKGPTLSERVGSYIPEAATKPLSWINEHVVHPPEVMAREGGNIAKHAVQDIAAEHLVSPEDLKATDNDPLQSVKLRAKASQQHPVIMGGIGAAADVAGNVVADPRQWPMLGSGAVGPLFKKALSGGFGTLMGAGAVTGIANLYTNWDKMNPEERAEAVTKLGLDTYFTNEAIGHTTGVNPAEAGVRGLGKAYNAVTQEAPGAVGYVLGGRPGYLAAKGIAHVLPEAPDSITQFGRTPEEISHIKLQDKAKLAQKNADKADADLKSYSASEAQGVPAPESVKNRAERTAKLAAEARFHADAAKEALEKSRAPKEEAPVAEAAQPEPNYAEGFDKDIDSLRPRVTPDAGPVKGPTRPINVKGPGEVQPETFPQEPTEKPTVNEGANIPLAEGEGMRLGKPKLLAETNPERPAAQEVLPPEKPAKVGKPERGNLRALTVDEKGNIVDKEETNPEDKVESLIREGLKPAKTNLNRVETLETNKENPNFPEAKVTEQPKEPKVAEQPKEAEKPAEEIKTEEKKKPEAIEKPKRGDEARDAEPAVQEQVAALSDENLKKLAKAHGIDPEAYDFKARDEHRHRVERSQLTKDITAKMGDDEVLNLNRNAQKLDSPDTASFAKADRAEKVFPRLRGETDEFGNPKVSGGAPDEDKWYHGTKNGDVGKEGKIVPGKPTSYTEDMPRHDAIYITKDKNVAQEYAGKKGTVHEVSSPDLAKMLVDEDVINDSLNNKHPDAMDKQVQGHFLDVYNREAEQSGMEKHPDFKSAWKEYTSEDHGAEHAEMMKSVADEIKSKNPDLNKQMIDAYGRAAHTGELNIKPRETVGTAEAAKSDTEHFANAKKELGENASISDVAKRAQEMKDAAAKPDLKKVVSDYSKKEGLEPVKDNKIEVDPRSKEIARAYDDMKHDPSNPEVKKSYDALINDAKKQWDALTKAGIKLEPQDEDPYKSYDDMKKDFNDNKRLKVFRGGEELPKDHPLAQVDPKTGETYNVMFRAVHDAIGHLLHDNDFSEKGESNAFDTHRQTMSKEAIPAMTTETKAQVASYFDKGKFPEQKAGVLPDKYTEDAPDPKAVLDHLKSGKDYALLTAENPHNERATPEDNAQKNREMKAELEKMGYKPIPIEGHVKDVEGQKENSFFVPDISPEDAAKVSRKFGQASVMTKQGIHDLEKNTVHPSTGILESPEAEKQDYHSTVAGKPFSVSVNFDKEEAPGENPRLAKDIGSWQAPAPFGVGKVEDVGGKARAAAEEQTGGPVKRGEERRSVPRDQQKAEDVLFSRARKDLGEDATTEEVSKRVAELKGNPASTAPNYHGEPMTYDTQSMKGSNMQHHVVTTDEGGRKIGELVAQDTAPGEITVRSNQIYDKDLRGQGRGVDQITHLLDNVGLDTKTVKSDISTSDTARKAWDKVMKFDPDAVTKQEFKDGQTQYSVDLSKWRTKDVPTVSGGAPDAGDHEISVKRSKGFSEFGGDQGVYDVKVGPLTTQMYRDPESGNWYEANTGEHFSKAYLGYNKADALEVLSKRADKMVGVKNMPTSASTRAAGNPGFTAGAATAKVGKLPKLAEEHLTEEEKAGVTKSEAGRNSFVDKLMKMPSIKETTDIAKAGEGGKEWYQRSTKAFDHLMDEAPRYFKEEDRKPFLDFTAALSPQQSVAMNLREALHTWTQYVDEGRPTGKALEKLLKDNVTLPGTKVPNAMKALSGQPLWPDLSKNKNFKVPSFGDNLSGDLDRVTNDGWMALFNGVDAKGMAKPTVYHAVSAVTRAAADALGWKPAEAQAAIWAFTKVFTEKGETDPKIIRQYSEDFADIMAHDPETRQLLQKQGVDLGKLDTKLKSIGAKPEITPGASPTTENSIGKLTKRIETARGKGTIPPPKSGYLGFGEDEDEGTKFNPEDFETVKPANKKNKLGRVGK